MNKNYVKPSVITLRSKEILEMIGHASAIIYGDDLPDD
jgi:hypothetical protein